MKHGSLFSGGGGFDLAAEMMGWTNVFHCEKDPFCRTILNHYWPKSKTYEDIRQFNGKPYKGKIDILTGGFPCQPFSTAGQRKGTDDDRYLWPEMLRIIHEIQPTWVVGENVYGLVNWSQGMVFDQVHADLERKGYEVRAFVLPAAGINAPHRRDRVWFVAHSLNNRRNASRRRTNRKREETLNPQRPDVWAKFSRPCDQGNVANTGTCSTAYRWKEWPSQSALCGRNDGLPEQLDGITISKWRRESIRVFGNAIVPHVVYEIFKIIGEMER